MPRLSAGSYSPTSDSKPLSHGLAALALAVTLILSWSPAPAAGSAFDKPAPYVLITKDGFRVDAMAKPAREGGKVRVRLAPRGMLTVLAEETIDWEATERYNAPRPEAPVKRSPVSTAEGARSIAGSAAASPGKTIEMTIIGSRAPVGSTTVETTEGGTAPSSTPALTTRSAVPTDPAAVAAQLAELRRQMDAARGTYDGTVQARARLEARRAELQQKVDREPGSSGLQSYQSPSRKALTQVETQLAEANEQISLMERRMSDIRFRAVELGGSVD